MAHWQLGEKELARAWYDKGVEWMQKNNPATAEERCHFEELRRFHAEAAEVLGIKPPSPPN